MHRDVILEIFKHLPLKSLYNAILINRSIYNSIWLIYFFYHLNMKYPKGVSFYNNEQIDNDFMKKEGSYILKNPVLIEQLKILKNCDLRKLIGLYQNDSHKIRLIFQGNGIYPINGVEYVFQETGIISEYRYSLYRPRSNIQHPLYEFYQTAKNYFLSNVVNMQLLICLVEDNRITSLDTGTFEVMNVVVS